jgi:hypothetical protein
MDRDFRARRSATGHERHRRTVFSGTETQEFGVEVLGVLPDSPDRANRPSSRGLTEKNVEKTGVLRYVGVAGLHRRKIVGAIAFSFPFSKEPIAGITPIKQMIDLFDKGSENIKPKEPRVVSFSQLAGTDWKPNLPKPQSHQFHSWRRFRLVRRCCRC